MSMADPVWDDTNVSASENMDFFVRLNDDLEPVALYRGNADVGEQGWNGERWVEAEFLHDCLEGRGVYAVDEDRARAFFPPEAF